MMPVTLRRSAEVEFVPEQRLATRSEQRLFFLAIAFAVGVGLFVRAFYVLSQDFPLNDGGLFYVMVQELKQAQYRLPVFSSYIGNSFRLFSAGLLPCGPVDGSNPAQFA